MHTIIRAILFAVVFLFLFSCSKPKSLSKAQDTVIHYLYQPALISDTFCKVLWHTDIDFRGLDPEREICTLLPKKISRNMRCLHYWQSTVRW